MAENPDYSLTIYSSAQPGQISTERLANYVLRYRVTPRSRRPKMTLAAGNAYCGLPMWPSESIRPRLPSIC